MKNIKYTLFLLWVLLILNPSILKANNEINIIEKSIKTSLLDFKYPEIHGLSNPHIQNQVNRIIYFKVFEFWNEDKLPLEDKKRKAYWGGYSIPYHKDHIISIVFNQTGYLPGAAHPNNSIHSITIDLSNGKALSLRDMFRKNVDYRSALNKIIFGQLHQRNIPIFSEFKGINPNQEFYLTREALVIYYQEEIYTPHAVVPLVFTIPYKELANILKQTVASG